jgi:8-oxo-dGTP pyrophosphatase MutT (NUDIX family)
MTDIDFEKVRAKLENPGIDGMNEYIQSAVLVPLIKIDDKFHLLFQLRCKHIRQGGDVCFPGGIYDSENDKDMKDTVIRETCEELGTTADKIEIYGQLDKIITNMGLVVEPFVGFIKVQSIEEFDINKNEVERIFTVPVSFFLNNEPEKYKVKLMVHPTDIDINGNEEVLLPSKDLGFTEIYHKPWGKYKYDVFVYKTDYGVIWGITAKLILNMMKILKGLI